MARPYGLLRAGFPYRMTLGGYILTWSPYDVAVGQEGRVYVVCRPSAKWAYLRVLTLDDEDLGVIGTMRAIGSPDKADDRIVWPVTIIADREENLFISDEALHRITGLSSEGEFLGAWGEQGDGPGQLNGPSGIAFDPDENIYVSDTLNHRVQRFTKGGEFLGGWGSFGDGDGEFNMPWGIAVDELGDVYVADWRNHRVQKFTADGEFVFRFGSLGTGRGEFNGPAGIAVDGDGDIYVVDCGNDRVQLFRQDRSYVQQFKGDATLSKNTRRTFIETRTVGLRRREESNLEDDKLFRSPRGIALDDEGRMFVADFASFRVQVYQKEAIPLTEEQMGPAPRSVALS